MPRGRNRSPAALSTVSVLVPGAGRPEPPPELDASEAKAWREVITALPAHWVDPAGQLILLRLAAQAAVAARLEEQMRQMRADGLDASKEAKVLAARHTLAAKSIADLLGQLRAAFADPTWATPSTLFTGFAFAGAIYFLISFGMSRYALFMERRLSSGQAR